MSESLRRGVELLEALRTADAGLGVRELAARVGLPKSTVARLLKTLDDCQLASQDQATRRYRLGPRTLALGAAYQAGLDLRRIAVGPMRRLRDLTGETVGLSVALGAERMFIEEVQSVSELRTTSELGHPYPIWAGAPGRVLVAGMAAEQRATALADAGPDAWRMATPPSPDGLGALLERIRADGYATASNESVPGVSAVAAPVHDFAGTVVAALSISGPSGRFTDAARHDALPELFATARTITAALGGTGH
ncbi:IclR family transcriptional regulator [Actinocatenispora thailandica]|uniref:Glycerol operon regulatory protein n=1 Tax=Actinocatenispora thailandica TaxID=227318 RepID=A0A7R7HX70_9ACTN|nr:IclR family transcriptional regulator [Actinocatenispora thailandica]BCJ34774.1 IclR family transcriptional regulator [Actinocatenispora thailandica]